MRLFIKVLTISFFILFSFLSNKAGATESQVAIPLSKVNKVAQSTSANLLAFLDGRTVKVYDLKTQKLVTKFSNTSHIYDLTFNPSGSRILTGDQDNTRKIWNARSGKLINILKGQKGDVRAVAYSPNGMLAASAARDQSIRVWDPTITKGIRTIRTKEQVSDIAFLANSRDIVVATYDGLEVWNSRTGKRIALLGSRPGYSHFILNKNSSLILAVPSGRMDEYVDIWDLKTKKKLHTLMGHKEHVNGIALSKDEKVVITSSNDDTVAMWDITTAKRLYNRKMKSGRAVSVLADNNPQYFWVAERAAYNRYQVPGLDPKFRGQFVLDKQKATSNTAKLDVFKKYNGNLLFREEVKSLIDLYCSTYQSASEQAIASNDYRSMYDTFEQYQPHGMADTCLEIGFDLYHTAMKTHFKGTLESASIDQMYEVYSAYSKRKYGAKELAILKDFMQKSMQWLTKNIEIKQQQKLQEFARWSDTTPNSMAEVTLDVMRELAQVDIRNVFKEGKIGERYVPVLSHGTSSTKTRYINGNAINETTYDSYTSGGHNESRYGYTSVYQMFNESKDYYLVDLEINATSSFTNYKTGKSWGGDEYKTSVSKKNRISQVTQYLLRPNENVKDQLVVGEKIPEDYFLKVKRIQPLSKAWVTGLDKALSGEHLPETIQYMKDSLGYNWLPELGAVFAGKSYRKLTNKTIVGAKFDKDFDSEVKVEFNNTNSHPVLITFTTNFDQKSHQISIPGNSKNSLTIVAKGVRESKLSIEYQMIEPVF